MASALRWVCGMSWAPGLGWVAFYSLWVWREEKNVLVLRKEKRSVRPSAWRCAVCSGDSGNMSFPQKETCPRLELTVIRRRQTRRTLHGPRRRLQRPFILGRWN